MLEPHVPAPRSSSIQFPRGSAQPRFAYWSGVLCHLSSHPCPPFRVSPWLHCTDYTSRCQVHSVTVCSAPCGALLGLSVAPCRSPSDLPFSYPFLLTYPFRQGPTPFSLRLPLYLGELLHALSWFLVLPARSCWASFWGSFWTLLGFFSVPFRVPTSTSAAPAAATTAMLSICISFSSSVLHPRLYRSIPCLSSTSITLCTPCTHTCGSDRPPQHCAVSSAAHQSGPEPSRRIFRRHYYPQRSAVL